MTPRDYALLAQQAYSAPPTVGAVDSAARAVVFPGGIIGFPGTDNLACWLADLDAEVVSVDGLGSLHAGFWGAMYEIKDQLLTMPAPVVVLGHSEGAALALLYAGLLCLAGTPPGAVYGFEPPRVSADGALGRLLAAHGVAVMLYRNGEDVVPLVPRLLHDWQHPAGLVEIGSPSLPVPNVEDHQIERVIAALAA